MRYWLNLFSPRTWEDFRANGSNITGFSENNWTRAKRIQFGDLFLCYLIGKKMDRCLESGWRSISRSGTEVIPGCRVSSQIPRRASRRPRPRMRCTDREFARKAIILSGGRPLQGLVGVRTLIPHLVRRGGWGSDSTSLEEAAKDPVRTPIDPKVIAMTSRKKPESPSA